MNNENAGYKVYIRHRSYKRAYPNGFWFDDLETAKNSANREMKSWWGLNGVYLWVKVKDCKTGKYIYTADQK